MSYIIYIMYVMVYILQHIYKYKFISYHFSYLLLCFTSTTSTEVMLKKDGKISVFLLLYKKRRKRDNKIIIQLMVFVLHYMNFSILFYVTRVDRRCQTHEKRKLNFILFLAYQEDT
jgi:hypothetical protein